ncbi:hypothetical protein BGZ46_000340 [Entomortierella lignicola]|nr:hypothetical protein BGZ46_000340 [Entomortierella lignicola]
MINPQPDTSRSPSPLNLEIARDDEQIFDEDEIDSSSRMQGNVTQYVEDILDTDRQSTPIELLHDFTVTPQKANSLLHQYEMSYETGVDQQQLPEYLTQEYSYPADSSLLSSQSKSMALIHSAGDSNSATLDNQALPAQIPEDQSTSLYMKSLLGQEIELPMNSDSSSSPFTSEYLFSHGLVFTGTTSQEPSNDRYLELLESSMRHESFASALAHGNNLQPQRQARKSSTDILIHESSSIVEDDNSSINSTSHSGLNIGSSITKSTHIASNNSSQLLKRQENQSQDPDPKCCDNCHTTSTPSWRRCPQGRILLCNACGLYHKLHGRPRPFYKTKDGTVKIHRTVSEHQPCAMCGTRTAAVWRKGENNESLCNDCSATLKQYRDSTSTKIALNVLATPAANEASELHSKRALDTVTNFDSRKPTSTPFTVEHSSLTTQSSRKKSRNSKGETRSLAVGGYADDLDRYPQSRTAEQSQQSWLPASNLNNTPYNIGNNPSSFQLSAIPKQSNSSSSSTPQLELWQQDGTTSTYSEYIAESDTSHPTNELEQQPLQYWTSARGVAVQPSANSSSNSAISYNSPLSQPQATEVTSSQAHQRQNYGRHQMSGSSYGSNPLNPSFHRQVQQEEVQQLHHRQQSRQQQNFQRYHQRHPQSLNSPYQYYQPHKLYQQQQFPSQYQSPYRGFQPQHMYGQHQSQPHRLQSQSRYQQYQQYQPPIPSPLAHLQQPDQQQSYFQEFTNSNYDITLQTNSSNSNLTEGESPNQPPFVGPVEIISGFYDDGSSINCVPGDLPFSNETSSSDPNESLEKPLPRTGGGDIHDGYGTCSASDAAVVEAMATVRHDQYAEPQSVGSNDETLDTANHLDISATSNLTIIGDFKDKQDQEHYEQVQVDQVRLGSIETPTSLEEKKKLAAIYMAQYQQQSETYSNDKDSNEEEGSFEESFIEPKQAQQQQEEDIISDTSSSVMTRNSAKVTSQKGIVLRRSERRHAYRQN